LTTIDQSALVQVASRNPKNAVARDDGQGSASGEGHSRSFDDLVSDAKQKLAGATSDDANAQSDLQPAGAEAEMVNVGNMQVGAADAAKRVRIATSFQQLLRNTTQGQTAAASDARPSVELHAALVERKAELKGKAGAETAETTPSSASEQLSQLLGLAPSTEPADDIQGAASPARRNRHGADAAPTEEDNTSTEGASASRTVETLRNAAGLMEIQAQAVPQRDGSSRSIDADEQKTEHGETDSVRLVSKDGKGAPVDIALNDEVAQSPSETSAQGGKTDFVTVLESRRYLGFSSDSNAANLAGAIKADPTWSQALNAVTSAQNAIEGNTATTVNTLKLQMNPENLGNMTASLRLKGEELTVEVRVETMEAFRHLSNDQDQIVKALKDQGFSIDQVTIQLSAPEKSALGQDSGNPSPNGQDGRDGLEQNARQREENQRRTANQGTWQDNDQTSSQSELASASRSGGAVDAGDIYL
jgi:chemotaxis protein MotD